MTSSESSIFKWRGEPRRTPFVWFINLTDEACATSVIAGVRNSIGLSVGSMAQPYRESLVLLEPTSASIAARKEIIGAGLPGEL